MRRDENFALLTICLELEFCLFHSLGKGHRVESVVLVDCAFSVEKLGTNKLRVKNLQITVDYRLSSENFVKWYETLMRMQSSCEYSQSKIANKSFAPVRKNNKCMFFIDGYRYFQGRPMNSFLHQRTMVQFQLKSDQKRGFFHDVSH